MLSSLHLLSVFLATCSALKVTPTNSADALAKAMLGPGIELVPGSAKYSGGVSSSGSYTNGPMGMPNGVVLTTGNATDTQLDSSVTHPVSVEVGTPGHSFCGNASHDAAVLEMTVKFDGWKYKGIVAEWVVATEEYPNFVGSIYNDIFGLFVDEEQIALDQACSAVSVNGPFFSSGAVITPPASGSSFGGSTPRMQAHKPWGPSYGHHNIKAVICDVSDSAYDSSAFVRVSGCCGDSCRSTCVKPGTPYPPKPSNDPSTTASFGAPTPTRGATKDGAI